MPELFAGSASYPGHQHRPVVSIGNFDGVHRGHRFLLAQLVEQARALGAPACVFTFEPPPRVVLAPQQHVPRILTWSDKVRLLGEAGVDQVVIERFSRSFAQHPAEWFAREILGRRLDARALVVGYDFRFGRARAGDVALLRRLLPQIEVRQVDAWALDNEVVSSSLVRSRILAGDVLAATRLLGRPHAVSGTVVSGERRGRRIGFRTANIETDGSVLPAPGVYAVRARVDAGDWLDGVANLGIRPTFRGRESERLLLEVHLFDFRGDIYGSEVTVQFIDRIRAEQRFSNVEALTARIHQDMAIARERLRSGATIAE